MAKGRRVEEERAYRTLLREIRTGAGLRQVDLARRLGRPQSFVSKAELGERRLDILELRQLCIECGTSLQEFARRLDERIQLVTDPEALA